METVKAIIKYLKLPKQFKGAIKVSIESYYRSSLTTDSN